MKTIVSFEIQNTENGDVVGLARVDVEEPSEIGPLVEEILKIHGHDDLVITVEVNAP